MTDRLTVQLVTWNSAALLPPLLDSLHRQTFPGLRLLVIDNASTDGSADLVARSFPSATILRNEKNLGYAGAHNQGFRLVETPYVLALNPDVTLAPDAIERLVRIMDRNPRAGSAAPKLLKSGGEKGTVDCAGLEALQHRQFLNRGEGEPDDGRFDRVELVFGACGACAVYRKSALDDVRLGGEYFDESFFAYKEDVDLAWRFLLAGWDCWYEPRAVGWHRRTARHPADSLLRRRMNKSATVNRLSYRNHLFLLLKNDLLREMLWPFPTVFLFELAKPFFLLLFEPRSLLGLVDVLRSWGRLRRQRALIRRLRKRSGRDMRPYFHPTRWTSRSSFSTTNPSVS